MTSVLMLMMPRSKLPSQLSSQKNEVKLSEKSAETVAELLKKAMGADTSPTDLLTREHFGFSKVVYLEDESGLLGLYHGLFGLSNPLSTSDMQEWQRRIGFQRVYTRQKAESGFLEWS